MMKNTKNIKSINKAYFAYFIIAALLIIWGVKDIYDYFRVGTQLIEYYQGQRVIIKLVETNLFKGIIKLVLSALALLFGFLRAKKGNKKSAKAMITINLAVHIFLLWFIGVAALTLGTANYVFKDLSHSGLDLPKNAAIVSGMENLYTDVTRRPDALTHEAYKRRLFDCMNQAISGSSVRVYSAGLDGFPLMPEILDMIYDDESHLCDTAVLFLDRDDNVVRESGDFLYFDYVTAENWAAGVEETSDKGWVDLGDKDDPRYATIRAQYAGTKNLHDWYALRLTGTLKDGKMEPFSMAIATDRNYYEALDKAKPGWSEVEDTPETIIYSDDSGAFISASTVEIVYPYSLCEADNLGYIDWDVRFDNTDNVEAGTDLVTIYALNPNVSIYEPQGEVTYLKNQHHENLLQLLKANVERVNGGERFVLQNNANQFDMGEMIVLSDYYIFDPYEIRAWEDGGCIPEDYPDAAYTLLTAMRASPLKTAVSFLTKTYIITFFIAALSFVLTRRNIIKNLVEPLTSVNAHIKAGWTNMDEYRETAPIWGEAKDIVENYETAKNLLGARKNEIARLGAALEYAKTAEENRRRLTSNIAHELKTPLAVVHSYAEGLKEHIADDKRDKYLDTILSETERMDGMVLEMLDLSRLEAGKVKLSRDEFSIKALCEAVFDKLAPLIEAKSLTLKLDFSTDCTVTADEGRISQVIENFASNAVKYTPFGGNITATGRELRGETGFYIQNDCEPFTYEQLSRVWDSFYRKDEARPIGGTGLGLAIAKNIVELHGGKCAAHNTKTGVEFSFVLPKGQ